MNSTRVSGTEKTQPDTDAEAERFAELLKKMRRNRAAAERLENKAARFFENAFERRAR